jgi:hypothetical protein
MTIVAPETVPPAPRTDTDGATVTSTSRGQGLDPIAIGLLGVTAAVAGVAVVGAPTVRRRRR